MFDFGVLPPEINSGRIYAGPGSGPMMAAASAWDGLAAELSTAASGYSAVIAELTSSPWIGPASMTMVTAVAPYIEWMNSAAVQSEEAGSQARAAAAAYELAFTMTVPPPVIAANRVLLATLVATNILGQNAPAIAVAEAQYTEMWAQDAAAMYTYAGSSAVATALSRFATPPNTSSPNAAASQSNAVSQVASTLVSDVQKAASTLVNDLQHTVSTIPQLLNSASLPNAAGGTSLPPVVDTVETEVQELLTNPNFPWWMPTPTTWWWQVTPANYTAVIKQTLQAYFGVGIGNFGWGIGQQTFNGIGTTAGTGGAWFPTPQFAALSAGGWNWHGMASAASATKVGGLSVPASWNNMLGSLPGAAEQTATKALSVNFTASPSEANATNGLNAALRGLPLGTRGAQRTGNLGVRYGFRYSVLTRPPSAG